ncbi:MAG: hypothetical protein HQM13_07865 [SAR324 cluster bacterium]|nr:hypothetical protein [SAR324 cluster bacterium]
MQRHAAVKNSYSPSITPGVSDDEALLVQLCEYLFDVGFLFSDAENQEIEHGQEIIEDFYEQEEGLVMRYLPQNLLEKFINYCNGHQWSSAQIEEKIRFKIVKAFDQLAQGASHSLNIQRNIHLGLMNFQQHALRDFLLYLTAYNALVLEEENVSLSDQSFSIDDLKNLRQKFQERMEGHKLVEVLLKDISRIRGGHMPLENQDLKKARKSYQFFRPSEYPQGTIGSIKPRKEADVSPVDSQSVSSNSGNLSDDQPKRAKNEGPASTEKKEPVKLVLNDDFEELEFEEEASSSNDDEADVIYGNGPITRDSFVDFIQKHPDSALKFMFRRNIDEKGLSPQVLEIYEGWEERGLKRGHIQKYILELMDWKEIPTGQTILELSGTLKDRIFELKSDY